MAMMAKYNQLKAYYILFVLSFGLAIAFVDRQMLNMLVDPIRADTGVTDKQIGLLQGPAFMITYTVFMFPVAWLSDRVSRKLVIIASLIAFSIMTFLFGMADSFLPLLLARAGVAIGEAAITPAAVALIRDSRPPEKQAFAVGIFGTGAYVGSGLALIIGGHGYQLIFNHTGEESAWRWLFTLSAVLGLVAVMFVLFMKEPSRTKNEEARSVGSDDSSLAEFFRHLRGMLRIALPFLMAFICLGAMSLAIISWFPTMLTRSGWSFKAAGLALGMASLVGGSFGALFSGHIAGHLAKKEVSHPPIRVLMVSTILLGISAALAAMATSPIFIIIFAGLTMVGIGSIATMGVYGFQSLFPAKFSARAVAVHMVVSGSLGSPIGPLLIPMVQDFVGKSLQLSIAIVAVTGTILALLCLAPIFTTRGRGSPALPR